MKLHFALSLFVSCSFASEPEWILGNACSGVLYFNDNGYVVVYDNAHNLEISNQRTGANGGGISAPAGYGVIIHGIADATSGDVDVLFENNNVKCSTVCGSHYGGGVYSATNDVIVSQNGSVLFNNNRISHSGSTYTNNDASKGGAIYGRAVNIIDNDSVSFDLNLCRTNSSSTHGGAIYAQDSLLIRGNEHVSFNSNKTYSSSNYATDLHGGAIAANGDILITENENIEFVDNYNYWAFHNVYGGAIYANSQLIISNNKNVVFSGNGCRSNNREQDVNTIYGGAIYSTGNNIIIRGNDSVIFEGNYEKNQSFCRLRSIYQDNGNLVLSAKVGASIAIRDSIKITSGGTVDFNSPYADETFGGDIIFTGATTESDLLAVKGGVAGTAQEILASRTSEVYTMTNLYGGRLRIEDGAIYKGYGITLAEGTNATLLLKDGELCHDGYNITITSGNILSAVGGNIITASTLAIRDGGTMHLALDMAQTDSRAVLTTTGNLSMGNISLDLTGTEYLLTGEYKLLTRTEGANYDISGWTIKGATADQLHWKNGTLYYTANHDWNHAVTDDDDISDLEEILGNLIINGGDITLNDVVQAIQDAVDAGFGHGQGHIVINRGGIHISGAGDLDGHIIFNGDLKDIRKLFIEKDITSIKIELGGSSEAENIVDVGGEYTVEIDSLSGKGSMNKTGEGEMIVHGNGNKVGGTLDVQEGTLTFTVGNGTSGESADTETEVHELVVGNKKDKEAKVKVDKGTKVKGNKMQVDGQHAVITNNGTMEFTEEVKVKNGHLDNQGSISKVTLEGGKVSGSGTFAGLEMHGGELVVGNSPGLQTYTDDVELSEGVVTFSLADAGTAATAATYGWSATAYSTIDMSGNVLTIGENVRFVLEIGGNALKALTVADNATLTFSLSLIQNIASESLTLNSETLAKLLSNTSIIITSDAEGLTTNTLFLAGRDITSMLSNAGYSYESNTLVFKGTVTNNGSLTIPEPTTATLSLLALAALATRRRRK